MPTALSLLGDVILTKEGEQKAQDVLAGKEVIALYFSAHWCGPCRSFTPHFAKVYEGLKASGKPFETVFVSSDRDEAAFAEYYGAQPWTALPYAARDAKAKLSKKFKVSGIPTVVLLSGDGKLLTTNGREIITNDPEGKEFPWPRKAIFDVLAGGTGEFLSSDDSDVSFDDLKGKHIGIYASASWCPPCKTFTPKLIDTYKKVKEKRDDFEIIFVSSDRSIEDFTAYFRTMPWLAITPNDPRKMTITRHFNIEGIPTFIMLSPDGKVINDNARGSIMEDPDGANFPWPTPLVMDVEENGHLLNESPSLVVMAGSADDAAKATVEAALVAVASAQAEANGEADDDDDDDDKIAFFMSKTADGNVAAQLSRLTNTHPSAKPLAVLIDIPDNGGYYTCEAPVDSEGVLKTFVNDYKEDRLERKQMAPPS